MRNCRWTASAPRIVSIPATSMIAVPTLKIPYLAPYVKRSPVGNGTAGTAAATETVARAESWPRSGDASSATSVSAVRAARITPRARQAATSWCQGCTREGRCFKS